MPLVAAVGLAPQVPPQVLLPQTAVMPLAELALMLLAQDVLALMLLAQDVLALVLKLLRSQAPVVVLVSYLLLAHQTQSQ